VPSPREPEEFAGRAQKFAVRTQKFAARTQKFAVRTQKFAARTQKFAGRTQEFAAREERHTGQWTTARRGTAEQSRVALQVEALVATSEIPLCRP
jgi:uncharacterized protein (DUF3084 family)